MTKNTIFYGILVALPFLLLLMLEGVLRGLGYGEEHPLVVPSEQYLGYSQPNPDIIHRYFPVPELAPNVSPDTVLFKTSKPKDSLRIVVMGGSSAAGFPYGRWGSIAGMLQQRFKRQYPDKEIEIINTAMSAINSYSLLDFTEEIIALQPDMVLLYAGHNEYLGIMGVGSTVAAKGGRSTTLIYLKLRQLRLYQLLENSYFALFSPPMTDSNQRTLMSKIAMAQHIEKDSALYQAGIDQFAGNLSAILAKFQKVSIPVFVGTLASNEQHQAPFASLPVETGASRSAQLQFQMGRQAFDTQQYSQAVGHFQQARDLDLLRFRAPSSFNKVIIDVTQQFGAMLVDTEQALRAASRNGIINNELMMEHLHPNSRGYFLLADAFADAIENAGLLPSSGFSISEELLWQEQPVTLADAGFAQLKINQLTADYPFTDTPKPVEFPKVDDIEKQVIEARVQGESWLSLNQQLLVRYQKQGNIAEAAKIAGLISDAMPMESKPAFVASQLYIELQKPEIATYYYHRLVRNEPDNFNYRLSLAFGYFLLKKYHESMAQLDAADRILPNDARVKYYRERVTEAMH